ncbi:thioredoxin family protein [Stygiolobus caldivivus]|uniref:Thioredoxin n=1 Tax=Stygiolobus caldivivus TaxID=2824673 RepID=A0A8D5U5X9_9CREN|nr:thioredoxin family protein [Stygiolobus caldivivus]BCU69456.1 thioredoxin [Stygiolobus caldivivus]
MRVEIFTHKTCTECNLLIEFLEKEGLLSKVIIIDTQLYPFIALERGVISTPSVFIDGKLIYAGVVDFEELANIIREGKMVSENVDKEKLVDKLMNGIVNSFAATAWLFVNRDFDAFMAQKDFVYAVTGLSLTDDKTASDMYNYLRNIMIKEGEDYLEKWKEQFFRVISANFIRELFYLYRKKLTNEEITTKYPVEVFAHWLMVRGGTVGRVGLRIHPLSEEDTMKRIGEVYTYMLINAEKFWTKIVNEEEQLAKSSREEVRFINF